MLTFRHLDTHAEFIAAGFPDPFYANLKEVSADETEHVKFLTAALTAAKAVPVAECTYSFPSTDVKSFVSLAGVLEGVGVSAYLGAAADIASKTYLTVAGSILTIEARHSAYLRASQAQSPFPQPFDDPLNLNEVYTLAAPFIVSCPASNPALPVKAFPSLSVTSTGTIKTGSTITLATEGYTLVTADGKQPIYAAFITVTGPIFVKATPVYGGFSLVVPAGVNGQSYVVLNACNDAVNDSTVAAGPAIVEIDN